MGPGTLRSEEMGGVSKSLGTKRSQGRGHGEKGMLPAHALLSFSLRRLGSFPQPSGPQFDHAVDERWEQS